MTNNTDYKLIGEKEAAYAAGVMDSDGCITIIKRLRRGPTSYTIMCTLRQTKKAVPIWFHQKFGGSLCIMKVKTTPNALYSWCVKCATAGRFLELIEPYLIGKKAQARVALKLQRTMVPRSTRRPTDDMLVYRQGCLDELRNLNLCGFRRYEYEKLNKEV